MSNEFFNSQREGELKHALYLINVFNQLIFFFWLPYFYTNGINNLSEKLLGHESDTEFFKYWLCLVIPCSQVAELTIDIGFKFFGMNLLGFFHLALLIRIDNFYLFVLGVESQLFGFDTLVDSLKELSRKLAALAIHIFGQVAELS